MYRYKALITDVYDGDTVTAQMDLGFKITFTEKLRLFRIDAPEIRGEQREEGLIVRDILREKILNKIVTVETIKDKKGKYGRYLAEIFIDEVNINDWLVYNGYAKYHEY